MKRSDFGYLTLLTILAVFIWLRNTAWMTTSDDTLPILIALPLFYWLGCPWQLIDEARPISQKGIVLAVVLFLIGIAINFTLLLTLGWVTLLWTYLSSRLSAEDLAKKSKLLILPIMAFPWVSLDAEPLGWWFRFTGAHATAFCFSSLGANVLQEGTQLLINGLPINVEVACAGLNTLQSMLIAGSFLAYVYLSDSWRYWLALPLLFILAWVANTIRIIVISFIALTINPAFALGAFHTWGGWLVLVLMFLLCWFVFSLLEPKQKAKAS